VQQAALYKIVHRDGYEVDLGFEELEDAQLRLKQLTSLGTKRVYVINSGKGVGKSHHKLKIRRQKNELWKSLERDAYLAP
jgi:hypothetical protein